MVSDRGHYRIYLGMAAGVGKTVRMLQEGHAELAAGRDVVVGLLETHGREGTAEVARGLEEAKKPETRERRLGSALARLRGAE